MMAGYQLLSLSPHDERGRVTLVVTVETRGGSEKKTYRVTQKTYEEIGAPVAGDELSEETMAVLRRSLERQEAVARAVKILSFGDNNRSSLARKLRERGHSEEATQYAVNRMVERGYIKEDEQIERLARGYAEKKLWGSRRIFLHLLSKGYAAEDVRPILARLSDGEIDFAANFERLTSEVLGAGASAAERAELKYKYGYE